MNQIILGFGTGYVIYDCVSIHEFERVCALIVDILLKKIVVYVFNIVIRFGMLQVLIELILNNSYNGVSTLLLEVQFLGGLCDHCAVGRCREGLLS